MKKGRPAHVLHCLARAGEADAVQELMWRETGTLGIRRSDVSRTVLPRHTEVVDVRGEAVRVKHGPYRSKPEHDDVAAAAARLGLPLREVARLASAAATREEES
jgi:uncharacterized protein (DUF111 family)